MVHKVSCKDRDEWLAKLYEFLSGRITSPLPGAPPFEREKVIKDRSRSIESLAEAVDILLGIDCEPSPAAFGQETTAGKLIAAQVSGRLLGAGGLGLPGIITAPIGEAVGREAEKHFGEFGQEPVDCGAAAAKYAERSLAALSMTAARIPLATEKYYRECVGRSPPSFGQESPKSLQEVCDNATVNFTTGYDAGLRMLRALRNKTPPENFIRQLELDTTIKQFEWQRQAAIDDFRKRCIELGGPSPEVMLPMFAQEYGQAPPPGAVGAAVGAAALPAILAVTPLAPLAPLAAPVGAEIGRRVEVEAIPAAARAFGSSARYAKYGALAQYGALFRGREAATNLARTYQTNGIPSFVYYDPTVCRPVPTRRMLERFPEEVKRVAVEKTPEEIAAAEEAEEAPPVLGPVATMECGMWRVEVGELTEAERQLVREGQVVEIRPTEKPPPDPQKRRVLVFPPTGTYGAVAERPTILDLLVEPEFGAIIIAGAVPKAPCDCAELPSGKLLCTREGAIGLLSQVQVRENCSEVRPKANGRLARAQILKEGQEVCGTLVEQIADTGQRFAARFDCLSTYLRSRGVSV